MIFPLFYSKLKELQRHTDAEAISFKFQSEVFISLLNISNFRENVE